jgi:hypothetical protein
MSHAPGRLPPFFHLGKVLSVLRWNADFSPDRLKGQTELLCFLHSKALPPHQNVASVVLREDLDKLIKACQREILVQHAHLKRLGDLNLGEYHQDMMGIVTRHGLYLHIRPIGVPGTATRTAARSHLSS